MSITILFKCVQKYNCLSCRYLYIASGLQKYFRNQSTLQFYYRVDRNVLYNYQKHCNKIQCPVHCPFDFGYCRDQEKIPLQKNSTVS